VTAAGIAVLSGASGAQLVGSGRVGVAVVILGVHLPAGLVAAVSMPAAWRRIVGETTTFGRAVRVTLPTMVAVAGLEAVKAVLPAVGYLGVTVLQLGNRRTVRLCKLLVRDPPRRFTPTRRLRGVMVRGPHTIDRVTAFRRQSGLIGTTRSARFGDISLRLREGCLRPAASSNEYRTTVLVGDLRAARAAASRGHDRGGLPPGAVSQNGSGCQPRC
jgi:hypothetical protein